MKGLKREKRNIKILGMTSIFTASHFRAFVNGDGATKALVSARRKSAFSSALFMIVPDAKIKVPGTFVQLVSCASRECVSDLLGGYV